MKSLINEAVSKVEAAGRKRANSRYCNKLYVACRNVDLIDGINSKEKINNEFCTPVFSSTSGTYYLNGVPVIYSQEDEAIIYSSEYAEYY